MTRARDVANIDGILTTKGDIYAATAAATPSRLGVGSNGETIVADSSTATGLRYTAGTVQSNPVINSAMQVWQRGTSFTNGASTTAYFGADRWRIYSAVATGRTWSRQATNDTTNLPFIQYCTRIARNSGDTQTNGIYIVNDFESVNSIPYAGKTITFSYYARCGANYSASGSGSVVTLITGTGTDQNSLNGFTGSALPVNTSATLTTTWQRFTFTATLNSNITQIAIQLGYLPTGTAGANDWLEITGVQIDIGSVALPFRTYAGTIQGELAACQRYYWRASATAAGNVISGLNSAYANNGIVAVIPNPVTMRVKASSLDSASVEVMDWITATASNSVTVDGNSTPNFSVAIVGVAGTPLTQYRPYTLRANASTGYIGFSAEL